MPVRKLALIGRSLQHAKSPVMQNAALQHYQLPFCYELCDVTEDQFAETILQLKSGEYCGANVTIPYKEKVLPYLDRLTPHAQRIGAVNTIFIEDGRIVGDNTDGDGYIESLLEEFPYLQLSNMRIAIIGAGGAAKAIAVSMAMKGIKKMYIANRTIDQAMRLQKQIQLSIDVEVVTLSQLQEVVTNIDLLIHCTPVGMYPNIHESIVPKHLFYKGLIVSDIVYNPLETKLLKEAKEMGAIPHNGVGMLVHQGALAFERWTGLKAPIDVMRRALYQSLSNEIT